MIHYLVFYANNEYHHCRTADDLFIAKAVREQYLDIYWSRVLKFRCEILDKHPFPSEGVIKHHKTLPQKPNEQPRTERIKLSASETIEATKGGEQKTNGNSGNERKRTRKTPPTQYETLF